MVRTHELHDGRRYLRIGVGSGLRLILTPGSADTALEQLQIEGRITLPARR